MDIDATFLPVAQELIDSVFPTPAVYRRITTAYDPSVGDVVETVTDYNVNIGLLSRGKSEEGGVGEPNEARFYMHHGAAGVPVEPETSDRLIYLGKEYKVVSIDPIYGSKGLIASKLTARYT